MQDKSTTRLRFAEARFEKCTVCGRIWNVSKKMKKPQSGYVCPACYTRNRKEQK